MTRMAQDGLRPRALILALNGLDYDRRVMNEARSPSEAGFEVIRVGVRTRPDHPSVESTGFDRIIRIRPHWYRMRAPADAATVSLAGAQPPLVRQWGWKLRLMAWLRRTFAGTLAGVDALRDWLRWNRAATDACIDQAPDLVLSTDFDALLAGWRIKRRTGCALIYDAHELWVDMPSRARISDSFRRLFILLERRLVRDADLSMTVGAGVAREMASRLDIVPPVVVFNGPERVLAPVQESVGPLRLIFQGVMEPGRGLEETLEAVVSLEGRVSLTLQGFGPMEADLRARVADSGVSEGVVTFVDPCQPEHVSACALGHDVGIVSLRPTCLNNILSMPNKYFTYLGSSLAVLTTHEAPEIASSVEQWGSGLAVDSWTPDAVRRALSWMAGHRDAVLVMQQRAHDAAISYAWGLQFAPVLEWIEDRVTA